MDVVRRYDMRVLFIYFYYYMRASWYFLFVRSQVLLCDFTYATYGLQPILTQALKWLGYALDSVETLENDIWHPVLHEI
jgi:hypothetical protein